MRRAITGSPAARSAAGERAVHDADVPAATVHHGTGISSCDGRQRGRTFVAATACASWWRSP